MKSVLTSWKQHVLSKGLDPIGKVTSGFKLSGSLVTAMLDAVKVTRFSEVEAMCHRAQSNTRWAVTQMHLP
jgi:hypothetical protein